MRTLVLPARGKLLVNTDLHGNLEDFERLSGIFQALRAQEPETHWVILGDVVHAPDPSARASDPTLYDFADGSMGIVRGIVALQSEHAGHVHFVLGNHDHGHVGGPHTHKFFDDEVEALEATLDEDQLATLQGLFEGALLAVVAPAGLLLCHGSPDDSLRALAQLDDLPLDVGAMSNEQRAVARSLLTSYGQTDEVSQRMLASVSQAGGWDLRVVVHGHDRDQEGFFYEGETQLCPVIFGAPRQNKRYVLADLAARYDTAQALRDGHELLRLYP